MKKDFIIALVLFACFALLESAIFFGYSAHKMHKRIDELQMQNSQLRSVIDSLEDNYNCGVTESYFGTFDEYDK